MRANTTVLGILCLSLALAGLCYASTKDQSPIASPAQTRSSFASKLLPKSRTRTARSLSDYFEKVKSKIFGSKKSSAATSAGVAPNQQSPVAAGSAVNPAQRQPWDSSLFNQQYGAYPVLGSNYNQWAANYPYAQMNGPVAGSQSQYPGQQAGAMVPGMDASSMPGAQMQPTQAGGQSSGGLFAAGSQLFSQYMAPNSGNGPTNTGSANGGQPNGQQGAGVAAAPPAGISAQTDKEYKEFSNILESMVSQTQRQPNLNQYLNGASIGQQSAGVGQAAGAMQVAGPVAGVSDQDMSGSSNIQSYMPTGQQQGQQPQQQASQKSSMVNLAEQLAPGAQFTKLMSFPFSFTNNDDPSKEGRFKLNIPYINQHVKRSDQQQQQQYVSQQQQQRASSAQQQPQQQPAVGPSQQYLTSQYGHYNSQPMYSSSQSASQSASLAAQSSQLIPSIVSPQSGSSIGSQSQSSALMPSSSSQSSSVVPSSSAIGGPSSSSSSSAAASSASSSSSSSSSSASASLVPQSNPIVSSSGNQQ